MRKVMQFEYIWSLIVFSAMLGVVLLSGCRSDQYYQDRAATRAREYLLKHSPELTLDQIYFVTYNAPVFLVAPIFDNTGGSRTQLSSDQQQICITWRIPGREYLYMVFGTSTQRMDDWRPNRLIRKRFVDLGVPLDAAMNAARDYALNYLLEEMSVAEYNLVRFTYPWVLETNFPLTADPEGNLSPDETAEALAKLEQETQLSLVWKFAGDDGSCMVFCGTGRPDLSGWKINFAGRFQKTALDEFTRRVLKTPDEANTPIETGKEENVAESGGK